MSSPALPPIPTVYSYLRFSSVEQRKGDSLRRQKEASAKWVLEQGYNLDKKLHLTDRGVSAWTGDNAETGRLKAFLDAVDSGHVQPGSILLVENLDRLSRQKVRKALELFLGILNRGITIQTLYPKQTFTPEDTDEISLITAIVVLSRAHGESEIKSVRSRANWSKRLKDALDGGEILTAKAPLWLKPTKDRKGFELIPDKAAIVQDIFRKTIEGHGILRLMTYLQQTYPKALGGHAKKWSKTSVQRILTDKAAIGEWQPHVKRDRKRLPVGDAVPNYYPAVVTEDVFYRAQDARRKNYSARGRRSPKCSNLFTGLVYDNEGRNMVVVEKDVHYLVSYDSTRGSAPYQAYPYRPFEIGLLMAVAELRGEGVEAEANRTATEELNALLAREKEVAERIKAIKKRLTSATYAETLLDVAEVLDSQANEIRDKISATKAKIKATSGDSDLFSLVDTLHGPGAPTGPDLVALREKTKVAIRQVVQRINVEYFSNHRNRRWLFVDVVLITGRHVYLVTGSGRLKEPVIMTIRSLEAFKQTVAEIKETGGIVL